MSAKLFVGNLSFNVTENDLQDAFAAHGTVVETNLMLDRATGRSRGFAFITMSSPEEAEKAISALNGASLDGRNLTVNAAKPREERPAGGSRRSPAGATPSRSATSRRSPPTARPGPGPAGCTSSSATRSTAGG